ncbi:hypothetical protein [Reichenbachiella ulvae]|uniref:Uncharacterized protein n=1 Tax=Reichenbachiella ulvae TaxID=2980104 RepID=A0ABT3CRH1_9BACT|nr:hypothetical protein [Reichenbachiella ulvae]MCV9386300.1 hypothetical protein [Reichenbachiella ulvae]
MKSEHLSKSTPCSFRPWHEDLIEYFKLKKVELQIPFSELTNFYHADYSIHDVYFINRTRTVNSALIELRWSDGFGRESVIFTNNAQIREFYKRNPDIHRVMKEVNHRFE